MIDAILPPSREWDGNTESAKLDNYAPETGFFLAKDSDGSPVHSCAYALIDAEDGFRVLVSRAAGREDDERLRAVFARFADEEPDFLSRLPAETPYLLLPSQTPGESVLLCVSLLEKVGLILALLSPFPASVMERAARRLGRENDVARVPAPEAVAGSAGEEDAAAFLAELFFYADAFRDDVPGVNLWTRVLRIANFAGCRLEGTSPPKGIPVLSDTDSARFSAALFCAFLQFRIGNGIVRTDGETAGDGAFRVRVEQTRRADSDTRKRFRRKAVPPGTGERGFLPADRFGDCSVTVTDSSVRLDLPVGRKKPFSLNSGKGRRFDRAARPRKRIFAHPRAELTLIFYREDPA